MLKYAHAYAKPPVSDTERARTFYVEGLGVEGLGFTPEWEYQGSVEGVPKTIHRPMPT